MMKIFLKILVYTMITLLIGTGITIIYTAVNMSGFTVDSVVIIIVFLVPGFALLFRKQISAWQAKKKEEKEKYQRRNTEVIWQMSPSVRAKLYSLNCRMTVGLPVAKDTLCTINLDGDSFDIQSAGMTYAVNYNKITDVQIQTETQVQHFFVSSAGGALAGNDLFGSAGAAIGGRIQHETITECNIYLFVAYLNETGPQYLLFRFIDWDDVSRIENIINGKRKQMSTGTVRIEL